MNKPLLKTALALVAATSLASWAMAQSTVTINPPAEGTVSVEQGLEAWSRIFEVTSHPRCSNCHAGEDGIPMWSGPSYGKTRAHGMNIQAGESRVGAETLPCSTCHTSSTLGNSVPHAPPKVDGTWLMAPAEANWFGQTSATICGQLKDPARNGNRTYLELAGHLDHDLILHWAWNPGGGREPAPYSLQDHVNDVLAWGVAGMPCPTN